MKPKPRIALDIDGVLADFVAHTHQEVKHWWGEELPPADHSGWPWAHIPEYRHDPFRWIMQSDVFNWKIPALPWAQNLYIAAERFGRGPVSFITARHVRTRDVTEMWLTEHLGVRTPMVLFTTPGCSKSALTKAAGIDLIVEDTLAEARALSDMLGRSGVLLLNQPWNQEGPGTEPLYQRLTPEQIIKVFEESQAGKPHVFVG